VVGMSIGVTHVMWWVCGYCQHTWLI